MPNDSADQSENTKHKGYDKPVIWAVLAALAGFAALVIVGRYFVDEHSERIKFVTVNTLSLMVLLAIIVQAYIYRRQWGVMRRQSKILEKQAKSMDQSVVYGLRAYVGIHSVGMDRVTGRFYFQIENVGRAPADQIELDSTLYITTKTGGTITVPMRRNYGLLRLFPGEIRIRAVFDAYTGFSESRSLESRSASTKYAVSGNLSFRDGFHKGENSPFAFRYDVVDSEWFAEPVIAEQTENSGQKERSAN